MTRAEAGLAPAAPRRFLPLGLGIAAATILLDQLSKAWILATLGETGGRKEIAPFFDLVLVWNHGVSFGLFNNGASLNAIIFSGMAAAIVLALLVWLSRAAKPLVALAIGLVIGGAIGNVIDRLRLGAVVDFLDAHLGSWHWPAFNVADSAICVGVALMVIDGLLGSGETSK